MPFVGGPNTRIKNPRWRTAAILKNRKTRCRGSSEFDEIWHDDAVRPSWPFRPLKIWNFKNQNGGGHNLEKSKIRDISATVWLIATKFGMVTQFDTQDVFHCWKFVISKIQPGGGRYFEKSKNRYLGGGFSDFDEIWHGDAVWSSWPFWLLQIWNFQYPRWRRSPSWKIQKSRYLGNVKIKVLTNSGGIRN